MISIAAIGGLSMALGGVKKVFIDGEAGTTGLQVQGRLKSRTDIELLTLPEDKRKDLTARQEAINEADAVILCLPDAAAIEAVALAAPDNDRTVFIDASTAHRTNPDWVYGFAEMRSGQRDAIASSKRIANPGCYPTGFIAATHPLVSAGLLKPDARLVASAVSGYSGGGKPLMEVYEGSAPHEPWGAYGFNLDHKHLPEMCQYSGLDEPPIFLPAVSSFAQGMVVSVPIHYDFLTAAATGAEAGVGEAIHAALEKHYAGARFVRVMPFAGAQAGLEASLLERGAFLRPDALNDTNQLELFVYCNDERRTCVVAARLDNLGKGASGAAVQNLNLALGLEEGAGLA
jgi:N-acetyl-gamma-glutamyl-phosphate reductase